MRVSLLPDEVRGRGKQLTKLKKRLSSGGLVILAGPGGIGKSTLARELVRTLRQGEGPKPRAWEVSAASLRSMINGLSVVARNLKAADEVLDAIKAPEPNGPDSLWRLLERQLKGWVLIVDNADDIELLAKPPESGEGQPPVLAEGTGWVRHTRRGLVIVTSRQREAAYWPKGALIIEVDALSEVESARILMREAKNAGTREEAKALARQLGGLPLALRLAGRYLGCGSCAPSTPRCPASCRSI